MKYDLSKTEAEIMRVLWEYGEQISTRELLDIFNEEKGKNWKRQTLNTLLVRMEEKEVLLKVRGYVKARYTEEEYKQLQSREIVNNIFGGKLSQFVLAFTGKNKITNEETKELERLIDELQKGKDN